MLKEFLYIYEAIKIVINSSKSKVFKNINLILTNIEITYLNNILNIIVGMLLQSTGTSITVLRYVCGVGLWMSDSSKKWPKAVVYEAAT
jgi:hypothetical protein